ncbi:hypothetical protein MHU86_22121 [Fragilaria crotonensis]|nr:hypothetical protein MHU86_22121 [Fragilaria crotonensis]
MKPTVPVPAFIAAAIMESYVTDPEELALMIVRTIKQRASEDPDPTGRRGWPKQRPTYLDGFSALQRAPEPLTVQQSGEWRPSAYSRRADDWAKVLHMKYLAVKAKSLIQSDDQSETPGRENDAIRNLSSLERQVASAVASSPQIPKTGFDSFPVDKADDPVRFGEGRLGRTPTRPVQTFADILALSNVAYVQNHIHHFLRNTKGRDAFIPMGFCAAIRTASFLADASDRPGAFSLFAGPRRSHDRTRRAGMLDHASTLVQMQLKTTDTTTGFSDKDIKSMTKLNFTIPRDFHELARLLENMAGWPSSSSARGPR